MIRFFLKNSVSRPISFTLLLLLLSEVIFPTAAMALSGGPSQPEVQSFEPVSTSEMVDVFSGDFKYNIPLMDVEGYPLNIAYTSGISTDQEASWVGLGWNLNVGSINRAMRGIPDDFKGDLIRKESYLKPNRTYGINAGIDFELFGKESKSNPGSQKGKKFKLKPSVGVAINYNNYTGFGTEFSVGVGISAGVGSKGKLDAGLGLHSSGASGLDISPNISYSGKSSKIDDNDKTLTNVSTASGALSGSFNTRAGLKQLSFNGGYTKNVEKTTRHESFNASEEVNDDPVITITENVSTISSKSRSAGGSVNFGLQSYVPSITMPMQSINAALSVKFSTHIFGVDADVRLGGFFSSQQMAETFKDVPAYGYMYSQEGQNNSDAMLDFNREKDGSFSRTTKNLPLTSFTYDVFNVAAQGMGGTFRPFRSDVGHVFDPSSYSLSDNYSLGAEVGGGNLFKAGIDVTGVNVNSTSGKWTDNNEALDYLQFQGTAASGDKYEPYYFKQVGEMSVNPSSIALYNSLMGDEAYGIRIQQGFNNNSNAANSNLPMIKSKQRLEQFNYDNNSNAPLAVGTNKLTERQKRNQFFATLSKAEAVDFGLQKDLYNGNGVLSNGSSPTSMGLYSSAPAHHIAEVSVVNTSGQRYYYGLPAYNIKNKECSFNISGANPDPSTGMVTYDNKAASKDNERGIDNHYNMTETPAYAHTYLLTAIVSADYQDRNNNGPDNDDYGTYTKFHYTKSNTGGDYKWRMPMHNTAFQANFSENSKSNTQDNSANFSYGEKEMWYLDEIETRNYIAKFILSDRKDGFGVADESGTIGFSNARSKKIDRIVLYSKPEYLANPTNAIPVKTVHFEYTYELCQGIPNNNGASATAPELSNAAGKLTLKNVYFTYGKSSRAIFNKYQFTYSASNPSYHNKANDRWGNYKPSLTTNYAYNNTTLANGEFPYVEQNKTTADTYAAAWHLTRVTLPSGGEINVVYEADDYAFVQNMPAGQMFKVVGATNTQPTPGFTPPINFDKLFTSTGNNNLYLILDVSNPALTINNDADFKKYFLKDINEGNKQLFFKFLVNLTKPGAPSDDLIPDFYEYVSGYADIERIGATGTGGLIYNGLNQPTGQAWIKLESVSLKNKGNGPMINPIAMSAIQFARINYGNVIWGTPFAPPADAEEALKQLAQAAASSLKTLVTGFKNPNKAVADKDYCQIFVPNKSMVRLYNPTGKKLGGGSRVERVYIDDKWTSMTDASSAGQASSQYGQKYTYEQTDEYGRTISSGVASYEPMIGGEENSLKQPYYLGKNKWALLAPDDRYYVEGPFGESFFPAPSVGYSKIKVQSIIPANATTSNKTGYKVYEFFTSKDYPTITKHTPIMPKQFRSPLQSVVKIASRDLVSASQGYVVNTNDMHGKAKAEYDYAEGKDSPEKETKFYYKTIGGYKEPSQIGLYSDASYSGNQLDNNCDVIRKDGQVMPSLIGVDFDAIADFRQSETETNMLSTQGNASSFLAGLVPVIVPGIWPAKQWELSRFRSAVLTKVVNQYGILQTTVVKENKSSVMAETLAYDAETGEGLVSRTTNDFNDPIYNLKFPAQWGYNLMGGAYLNTGIVFQGTGGSGTYNVGNNAWLNVGDELALTSGATKMRAWACSKTGSNTIGLIDNLGFPVSFSSVSLKVIRSARRNQIIDQMAVLTSLNNPIQGNNLVINSASQVLDAKGTKFDDNWQIPKGYSQNNCNCTPTQVGIDLVNFLDQMLDCNISSGSFFNGAFSTPYNSIYDTPLETVSNPSTTPIWRDAAMTTPYTCPNAGVICSINPGFPAAYGFTQNLLNQIGSPCANNSKQYVVWMGPTRGAGSLGPVSLNNQNQLIGYFLSCNGSCFVSIDFGSLTPAQRNLLNTSMPCSWPTIVGSPMPNINITISPNQTNCASNELACNFEYYFQGLGPPQIFPVKISASCLNGLITGGCSGPGLVNYQCGNLIGNKTNPFLNGIKGNWRPKANYTFLTDRQQTIAPANQNYNTDTRQDGYYKNFSSLYSFGGGQQLNGEYNNWGMSLGSGANKWVSTVETTKYNYLGVEVETKDAMGRYSSALYGYNESLPVAVAGNAQLREIAVDNFEDYTFTPACSKEPHFDFSLSSASRSSSQAHTGKYSLELLNNTNTSVSKVVFANPQSTNVNSNYCNYVMADRDFIYPFSPINNGSNGMDYVISYWVKETGNPVQPLDYVNNQVEVLQGLLGSAFPVSNLKKSALIDGWQRVEYSYKIPSGYSGPITVKVSNTSTNGTTSVYLDDIRMHPFNSSMKTYVYDPVTLKYVAELDANNFATLYEYDEQGNLVRVKKETAKGIMTLKESKTHYARP